MIRSLLIVSATLFSLAIYAQEEPEWDEVESLISVGDNLYRVSSEGGWANSHLKAFDLESENKSGVTNVMVIELNPSVINGDFISGFIQGELPEAPFDHKGLDYAFDYNATEGMLYLLSRGKVVANLGRVVKSTTIILEVEGTMFHANVCRSSTSVDQTLDKFKS